MMKYRISLLLRTPRSQNKSRRRQYQSVGCQQSNVCFPVAVDQKRWTLDSGDLLPTGSGAFQPNHPSLRLQLSSDPDQPFTSPLE